MSKLRTKIGIRPVFDGRCIGIRASLEEMRMARRVATLYTKELRHADGNTVEFVIAGTTIGGVPEALPVLPKSLAAKT